MNTITMLVLHQSCLLTTDYVVTAKRPLNLPRETLNQVSL